jgi:hypothetical protein
MVKLRVERKKEGARILGARSWGVKGEAPAHQMDGATLGG